MCAIYLRILCILMPQPHTSSFVGNQKQNDKGRVIQMQKHANAQMLILDMAAHSQ